MATQPVNLSQNISENFNRAQSLLLVLKGQRPDIISDLEMLEKSLSKIPRCFQEETSLLNEVVEKAHKNFTSAKGEENVTIFGAVLMRMNSALLATEKHWLVEISKIKIILETLVA